MSKSVFDSELKLATPHPSKGAMEGWMGKKNKHSLTYPATSCIPAIWTSSTSLLLRLSSWGERELLMSSSDSMRAVGARAFPMLCPSLL